MKLIQFMWEHARKAWKIRNDVVHDKSDSEVMNRYAKAIQEKVTHMYTYENRVSAGDRDIFAMPLEERLRMKPKALESWYENTFPMLQECVQSYQERVSSGMKDIRDYWPQEKKKK